TAQDDETIDVFVRSPHCVSVQTQANVFGWSRQVLAKARRHNLVVLARSPLAMGLLSGKYHENTRPAPGDVRLSTPWWTYFDKASMPDWLRRLGTVRDLLTSDGRTLVQGSLAYLWALDPRLIPLPGVRTAAQAIENTESLTHGALPADIADQITTLLADSPERS
ncbi:MAG TPA: aldo/keto reductase, partial [Nocardioidaceae bacterium]